MTTIRVKFRSSTVNGKEGTLYYQVSHNRTVRKISTGHKIMPDEWDNTHDRIFIPTDSGNKRCRYLQSINRQVDDDIAKLKSIASGLENRGKDYDTDEIIALFRTSSDSTGFLSFSNKLIDRMRQTGKQRTAETYTTAINSFTRFNGTDNDIPLDRFDSNLIMEYEAYLQSYGLCPNSSSFYMRNLRAIYNRAVDMELTAQRNPFRRVYTGIDKTVKRAIPATTIRKIRNLELSKSQSLDFARDMFMFSFYTRGMSFVDMAYLQKKDLRNGILSYRRQKTGQQLFVKWERPMQEIIDKYDTSDSPYLLPIIKNTGTNERRQYKTAAHFVNNNLKKIGNQLGISIPLTTYVARHSWASIAKSQSIPISTISEAMGHDSENTTRIYLASLDCSVIDKANSIVINSI